MASAPETPITWSGRLRVFLNQHTLLFLGVALAAGLSLSNDELIESMRLSDGARQEFHRFFTAMTQPTLTSQGEFELSLLPAILDGVRNTLLTAFAAMSLALVLGFVLGCLISDAFWEGDTVVSPSAWRKTVHTWVRPLLLTFVRSTMAGVRSIHELVWALILTSMFSVHVVCGILAVALPYAATLGRIYGEMLDEVPRDAARAMRALGASDTSVFCFALLPRAAPAMISYSFYRFDCCLRSTAILGFFGFPTLGLYIKSSFNYAYYREVWTYLWVLFLMLAATEALSGLVRRRIAA